MSYSNNKFPDCPALMEDGKIFTDYRSNKIAELDLAKKNKIGDSQSYRLFLQNNAEKIIINNKEEMQKYVCSPRKDRKYDPLSVKNFRGFEPKGTSNYSKF
jgi:hypothetical protein